jgi:hypothetical protein
MRINASHSIASIASIALAACATDPTQPSPPTASAGGATAELAAWGSETPRFNLEVILEAVGTAGFGLVKFRQPNDDATIVYLDTWVRDLAPNTSYYLERAVDLVVDDDCTSSAWLTLGEGPAVVPLVTDETGSGRAALWRAVPPTPGVAFDIHFRVRDGSGTVLLQSGCYQYTISL